MIMLKIHSVMMLENSRLIMNDRTILLRSSPQIRKGAPRGTNTVITLLVSAQIHFPQKNPADPAKAVGAMLQWD